MAVKTTSPTDIAAALAFIPAEDRDIWVRMAMAIRAALGEDGFAVWDEWSQSAANYQEQAAKEVWKSVKPDGGITLASLFALAREQGYTGVPDTRPALDTFDARWQAGTETGAAKHPYLKIKGVGAHGLRVRGKTLMIPVRDLDGKLLSVQSIYKDREGKWAKIFFPGSKVTGGSHSIGDLASSVIIIAEGYATGASIHEATGYAVVIAFDCQKLAVVSQALRAKYPATRLLIAGDDDIHPDKPNPGRTKAATAAKAIGCGVVFPAFADGRGGDFNDLHQREGLDAVRTQIESALVREADKTGPLPKDKNSTHNSNSKKPAYSTQINTGAASSQHAPVTNQHETLQIPSGAFVIERDEKPPTLLIESEAARRLAEFMQGHFALNASVSAWHRFTGTHWGQVKPDVVDEAVTAALYAACDGIGFRARYQLDVSAIIRRGNLLPLPEVIPGKLPFRNGLLDVVTGELVPVTALNADRWCIPHDYHAGSHCPAFRSWLDQATGQDAGKQTMLLAFIAAALTGRADLQKFVFMRGPGGTGKSTFMRLLQEILGEANCESTDLKSLEVNRFETAKLYGKRLVTITDTDKYGGSVNVLKALTGQDAMRNEQKHIQQGGTFTFGGMVLMAGNETLQTTDYTSGLGRRMVVLDFDRVLTAGEKRAFLGEGGEARLREEIPAIINWALTLDRDHVAAVFMHPPDSVQQSTFDAAADQNPLLGWITDSVSPKAGSKVHIGDRKEGKNRDGSVFYVGSEYKLYPNYLLWCKHSGRESVSLQRFSRLVLDVLKNTLQLAVIKGRDGSGAYLQGIRLDEAAAAFWRGNE